MHMLLHIFTCAVDLLTNMLTFKSLRAISRGGGWKKVAFPSPLVWPSFIIHPWIHPSRFSVIVFRCSQSLFLSMGGPCLVGGYGKMPLLIVLLHLVFWFAGTLPMFSVWNSVYGIDVSVCSVYVSVYWILITLLSENAVTTPTAPTSPHPPCSGIWEEHRTRVRRLPSSHLWALTLPEKQTLTQTHSQHMQCLAPLSDLHMSPSSSLIHRHTVELFKSIRLVSH